MPSTSPINEICFAGCPECGAQLHHQARFCWLCGAPQALGAVVAKVVPPPLAQPNLKPGAATLWQRMSLLERQNPWQVHGAIWGLLLVEGLIAYGLINSREPMLAWLFAFTIAPAFVLTLALAIVARLRGKPWGPLKKLAAFLGTIAMTIVLGVVVIALLVIAGIIALVTFCFGGG